MPDVTLPITIRVPSSQSQSVAADLYRMLLNECGATFEVAPDVVQALLASELNAPFSNLESARLIAEVNAAGLRFELVAFLKRATLSSAQKAAVEQMLRPSGPELLMKVLDAVIATRMAYIQLQQHAARCQICEKHEMHGDGCAERSELSLAHLRASQAEHQALDDWSDLLLFPEVSGGETSG
jgi:hypothetical protein